MGTLDLAEVAAENIFEIEPDNAGNHVLLSNIHAAIENGIKLQNQGNFSRIVGRRRKWERVGLKVTQFTHLLRQMETIRELWRLMKS